MVCTSRGIDNDDADDISSNSDDEQFSVDDNFYKDDQIFEDASSMDEAENGQQSVGIQQQDLEVENVIGTSDIPT